MTPTVKHRGRLRSVYRAITTLAFLTFFAAIGLNQYFAFKLPKRADPAAGRMYALANHGGYVYMTRTEQYVLLGLFGGAILGILVAVALRVADEGLRYKK